MRRMLKSRKAVSPVIATIIIVAIAISIAIAVAYWMVGITGAFTRFEKLEIVSAYAEGAEGT
ncbi:MAG: archaellin/type IV pilin N-terminal domain-containing protein, partial [Candidatus Bathyarchaeia archaeon]